MSTKVTRFLKAGALCAVLSPAAAWAAVIPLTATLDAAQEVQDPPVISTATGSGVFSFDTDTNLLDWNITFSGLTTNEVAAHIHGPAAVGENAGIQIPLSSGSPKIGSATLDNTQEADLLAGLYYVNIHTVNYPGGEIRGQIIPVPEASTFMMMGAGAITLAVMSRLRRKPGLTA